MKKVKATQEEKELVITEIAERLKDMIYATGERKVADMVHKHGINRMLNSDSFDTFGFTFRVEMVTGDIQQIVARHRRI